MQASTIFLDVFGVAAMGVGIFVAANSQSKLRTTESRRKALQARLEELEKKLGQPQSNGVAAKPAARETTGSSKGADKRVAELEAALTRADEEKRQLEVRYESRLKELTAAANAAASVADSDAARLPRPKTIVPASGVTRTAREPMTLLLASSDGHMPAMM